MARRKAFINRQLIRLTIGRAGRRKHKFVYPLCFHRVEQMNVRAGHAAVQDIADECDGEPFERAADLADGRADGGRAADSGR